MTTRYHTKMAMTTNYLKSWSMPAIHGQLFQKTMRSLLTFFALQSILINGSSKVVAISAFFCFFLANLYRVNHFTFSMSVAT